MKSNTSLITLIISSALVSLVFSCTNGKSNIIRMLENIQYDLPKLIQEVQNMPECRTDALRDVCSKGYQYWNSKTDVRYFKGVYNNYENLEGFIDVLLQYSSINSSDRPAIKRKLLLNTLVNSVDGFALDIIYNQVTGYNKGTYITYLSDTRCDNSNELDILYCGISNDFKLPHDIFLIKESYGSLNNPVYLRNNIYENKNFSQNQYAALIKLMQISIFANARELIQTFENE